MLDRIPLHIAVQIERQAPKLKVNSCDKVKPDRQTFVQNFVNLQQEKNRESFFEENNFEKILLALLKNNNINPYNVNQNILLAKEYLREM